MTIDTIQQLTLETLHPAKWNPRQGMASAGLEELTQSIQTHGVLVPLLVRKGRTPDAWEIVAGHRRAAAARAAGLVTIPCVVRELDDEAAQVEAITENLQRENLSPLDEARAFRKLLTFGKQGQTAAAIARRLGKSERYVWERARLLDLVPDAQTILETGRITVAHAIALSRLTPAQQAKAIDPHAYGLFTDESFDFEDPGKKAGKWDGLKARSVREFEGWITDHVRFDPAQAATAAPLDFGPTAEQVATATAQPGRGKKVISITHDSFVQTSARDAEGARTFCAASWRRADGQEKSKTCERSLLGVVVVGPGYGEAFPVCIDKACDVHWKAERLAREKQQARRAKGGSSKEPSTQAREQEKWKARQAKEDADRKAWDALKPTIIPALAKAIAGRKISALAELVLSALDDGHRFRITISAEHLGAAKTADAIVRHAAFLVLLSNLNGWNAPEDFPRIAKRYGVDVAAIRKVAQAGAAKLQAEPTKTEKPAKGAKTKRAKATG